MGRRIRWLGVVLILAFALVMVQLVNVQFRQANALANSPDNPRVIAQKYTQSRGYIYAADGTVLAQSVKSPPGSAYEYERQYPTKALFEQVVGYDSYIYGMAGVEEQYNSYLEPHHQSAKTIGQLLNPPPPTTDNVTLTVEPSLQELAQQELAGRDGAVVVLNPTTGAVEAMYSNPSFDPSGLASPYTSVENLDRYAQLQQDGDGYSPALPIATSVPILPGSTFKVVTSSAVYDYKPQLATKEYPVVSAISLPYSNQLLHNDGDVPCGGTLVQMLPASCDPGYGQVGMDLGSSVLAAQAERFGFNKVPPIDLPGVVPSPLDVPAITGVTNQAYLAYTAIGQYAVHATALQMALVAAGIADGGVVMTPHVMAQIRDSQGNLVSTYQPTPWVRATTQQAAAQVTSLMEGVVTNGTADGVGFLPQDQVAAKTGTAQTGNHFDNTNDWMIAFAPASDPQVAVAVTVPDQPFSYYGATVAGPIVKAMIEAALSQSQAPSSGSGGTLP